jgi:hypothetical protein
MIETPSGMLENVTPSSAERIALNVRQAKAVTAWLDRLGLAPSEVEGPARIDRGLLSADLSDLYVIALDYQQLLDALLETTDRQGVAEIAEEIASELHHAISHARTAARQLERLADLSD